jgi:hypothetical protein
MATGKTMTGAGKKTTYFANSRDLTSHDGVCDNQSSTRAVLVSVQLEHLLKTHAKARRHERGMSLLGIPAATKPSVT